MNLSAALRHTLFPELRSPKSMESPKTLDKQNALFACFIFLVTKQSKQSSDLFSKTASLLLTYTPPGLLTYVESNPNNDLKSDYVVVDSESTDEDEDDFVILEESEATTSIGMR